MAANPKDDRRDDRYDYELPKEKMLPQNVEAEAGVLGGIEIDQEAMLLVRDYLAPADFYREAHRIIYEAMCDLYDASEPIDLITLTDELARRGKLDEIGGIGFVSSLGNQVPTSANVEYYARIVERTAILRRLIHAAGQIAGLAYDEPDALAALDKAEKLLQRVSGTYRHSSQFRIVGDGLHDYIAHLAETMDAQANGTYVSAGVPTGFRDLDRLMGNGFQSGDLIILAARPALGKSSLAFSMAHNAAKRGATVAVFSLEMNETSLLQRLLAMEAGVALEHLRSCTLPDEELERVLDAAGRLQSLPLYLDDTTSLTLAAMRAKLSRLWMDRPVDLVVVDYLQLLDGARTAQNYESRRAQLGEITRELKRLAGEFQVPVLVLSQLSREIEKRADKKPMLSDLAESGSIEQDADVVMFLHRDEVYDPETTRQHMADVIVAKHRNGPLDTFSLYFQANQTRYRDLELYDHAQ